MLSAKWKWYLISNIIHMAGCIISIIYFVGDYLGPGISSLADLLISLLILFMLAVLLSNSLLNIILLEKYYPHKYFSPGMATFSGVLYIITTIIVLVLLIGSIVGTVSLVKSILKEGVRIDIYVIIRLSVIYSILVSGLHICYRQPALRATLRANARNPFDEFLP